ncbi:D-alanyl-D-alanine carboxypeptidase [Ottowia sp.]|uniref:D-alanyl-D-alanine carboxypeptidase/D-alanyl-D-alanine-endopeptidase n=1 Tax=Ottowia sp. TaxID=1898956 RepID=UPI002BD0FB06|nr:D-alanyl-D-alanine carboxypeptidase [Ottowia sp.]HOB67508.1 D-alanyl-D-alanine carboxypeptidase [Ottowia sp.]HPZ57380.1 D-alanyl-D-alanine carboxypeptidase [Ottowia sp.]HQD49044.1 D-alanyl-D-alanine carboxypeptidase [Ottowia sp.]
MSILPSFRAALALSAALAFAAGAQTPAPAAGERSIAPPPAATATPGPANAPAPASAAAPTTSLAPPATPPRPDATEVWAAFQKAGVKDAEVALLAQPLAPGAPLLLSHNEKLAFTLASTTKVITTLASLQTLPTSFRWRTRAWLTGAPADGKLAGDLVLVGGGDATLDSQRLTEWFKRLHKQGLTQVQGHIVLDQSLFRLIEKDHANTPVPEAGNPHHALPDAFVLDDSRFRVTLRAGDGGALAATFDPPLGQIEVVNQTTGGRACTAQARFEPVAAADAARPATKPAPPIVPVSTAAEPAAGASAPDGATQAPAAAPAPAPIAPIAPVGRVIVSGAWSPRCTGTLTMEAAPGRALTAALVAGAWAASGGQLTDRVLHRDGATPTVRGARRARTPASPYPGKPWATLDSPPLPELVRAINKDSNNLMARNLLLSMAPGFSPTTSTLQLAKQRLGAWFKKLGLAQDAPNVDNGSGLAHSERGSVLSMVQLLQAAWNDPKTQKIFVASLPVAGADGTLAGRFKGSPAQRNAFLKTGTLTGVRSLAGYVRARSGRMVAVAVVVNSERATAGVPALDGFIEWVWKNG